VDFKCLITVERAFPSSLLTLLFQDSLEEGMRLLLLSAFNYDSANIEKLAIIFILNEIKFPIT
jgi:hypothetical protein